MKFRINSRESRGRFRLDRRIMSACAAVTLSFSLPANAIEWGDIYLGAGTDRFFFQVTLLDVPPSTTDHLFLMYTKLGVIIVQPNQESFLVVFNDADGGIIDSPRVEPIGTPDIDRWVDGPVTDFTVSKSVTNDWTISGSIENGTQPYVPGNSLGEIRFTYSGGIIANTNLLIEAPPSAEMSVTKTSSTQSVWFAGQVVPYEYVVYNTGQIVLHEVALSDDNVDATPICAFPGADELSVEGEPGSSVVCTAQHTVTQDELNADGTLDNTATATSDEAEPVTASYSIPIAVFSDGFEEQSIQE